MEPRCLPDRCLPDRWNARVLHLVAFGTSSLLHPPPQPFSLPDPSFHCSPLPSPPPTHPILRVFLFLSRVPLTSLPWYRSCVPPLWSTVLSTVKQLVVPLPILTHSPLPRTPPLMVRHILLARCLSLNSGLHMVGMVGVALVVGVARCLWLLFRVTAIV